MPRPPAPVLPAILALSLLAGGCERAPVGEEAVRAADAFAASQPLYLQPFPYTPVPDGIADLRPETCGACHAEIYEEWRVSTHARAWEDAQFQAELEKQHVTGLFGTKADARWMCVNCHIPLVNQQEERVVALRGGEVHRPVKVRNPQFMPDLVDSAIGCATCHVRGGVVYGPYGDTAAPHPVARDDGLLRPDVCLRCHQAEAEFPKLNLVCVFRTGAEWEGGPWDEEGRTCQTCHMPEVERPLVAGGPPRPTRRHWFGGSLIPKHPDYEAEIAPLRDVYPDGLELELVPPPSLPPGGRARVEVRGTNAHAGHLLPTGDPERFIEVEVRARDGAGGLLAEAKHRIGSRYEWYPEVKLLEDNRLKLREERRWALEFDVPEGGEVRVEVVASKHRLTEETMAYHHLDGRYVAGRRFYERTFVLPVGEAAPAPPLPPGARRP